MHILPRTLISDHSSFFKEHSKADSSLLNEERSQQLGRSTQPNQEAHKGRSAAEMESPRISRKSRLSLG